MITVRMLNEAEFQAALNGLDERRKRYLSRNATGKTDWTEPAGGAFINGELRAFGWFYRMDGKIFIAFGLRGVLTRELLCFFMKFLEESGERLGTLYGEIEPDNLETMHLVRVLGGHPAVWDGKHITVQFDPKRKED